MKNSIIWLAKVWADELARRGLWVVFAVTGVVAGFVLRQKINLSSPAARIDFGLVALLILVIGVWLGRTVYCKYSYRHANYPKIRFHYEILEKNISYKIGDDGILLFTRTVKLRALVDNLDSYVDKYVWTGGHSGLPLPGAGCSDTKRILRAGIWTFYSTDFSYVLRRGQVHEFTVRWPPLTDWRSSSPFVSTSTEEPTRLLRFVVELPEDALGGTVALAEELRGIESAYPFNTHELAIDRGRIEWLVHPKLYRHYRLRWSWSHGEDLQSMPTPRLEEEASAS